MLEPYKRIYSENAFEKFKAWFFPKENKFIKFNPNLDHLDYVKSFDQAFREGAVRIYSNGEQIECESLKQPDNRLFIRTVKALKNNIKNFSDVLYLTWEDITNYKTKKYKLKEKIIRHFSEELRLSDLRGDSGISALTKKFKKDRTSKAGSESQNATIIEFRANRNKGWIEFTFRTRSTPYPELKDVGGMEYQRTNKPSSWKLKQNPSRTYFMKIRILDFFKWLKTSPEGISNKEIEDVLEVAFVKLHCTCPSFNYQGFAYYLDQVFDASIYTQTIAPTDIVNDNGTVIGWKSRHNDGDSIVCKHLSGLISNIKFYIPQMRQKIVTYLNK